MMQGRSYLAGLVTGVAITGLVGFVGLRASAAPRIAATDPAPTEAAPIAPAPQDAMPKPAVKVLLENDKVRVREVVFAPGAGDTHTHPWAHVGVILTKGQLAFADAGKPEEVVDFEAGSVGFREAKVTHLARNPGKIPMKVIEVEVK
jgi:mannose-6-phosphate isomerase-like protein (cupin superfamily)